MKDDSLLVPTPPPVFPELGLKILGHCILCSGPCYGSGSQIHTEVCAQFREQFEALRKLQLKELKSWGGEGCAVCGRAWLKGEPEHHSPLGCIAAPFKKKEVPE